MGPPGEIRGGFSFGVQSEIASHRYSAAAAFAACFAGSPLRAARHSSKRRTTTKNDGTNRTARQVEASIPLNTAMPIDLRALAPAPVASTSGTTPRMKANHEDGPEADATFPSRLVRVRYSDCSGLTVQATTGVRADGRVTVRFPPCIN